MSRINTEHIDSIQPPYGMYQKNDVTKQKQNIRPFRGFLHKLDLSKNGLKELAAILLEISEDFSIWI